MNKTLILKDREVEAIDWRQSSGRARFFADEPMWGQEFRLKDEPVEGVILNTGDSLAKGEHMAQLTACHAPPEMTSGAQKRHGW